MSKKHSFLCARENCLLSIFNTWSTKQCCVWQWCSNWNFFEFHCQSLPCIFLTFPIFYSFLSFFVSRGDKDRLAEFWVAGGHRPVSSCDRLHVYTCGRSFVITYATSAWMSQFFLQSSFALHMCAVLNYLHPFTRNKNLKLKT